MLSPENLMCETLYATDIMFNPDLFVAMEYYRKATKIVPDIDIQMATQYRQSMITHKKSKAILWVTFLDASYAIYFKWICKMFCQSCVAVEVSFGLKFLNGTRKTRNEKTSIQISIHNSSKKVYVVAASPHHTTVI